MDIRNFFGRSQSKKAEEDDFAVGSKTKKVAKKMKKVVIDSDSDEGVKSPKPTKSSSKDVKSIPAKTKKAQSKKEAPAKRKEVAASDFFGGGEIRRVPAKNRETKKSELEEHSDEEFQEVLKQLDEENVPNTPTEQPSKRVTRVRSGSSDSTNTAGLVNKGKGDAKDKRIRVSKQESTPKTETASIRSSPRKKSSSQDDVKSKSKEEPKLTKASKTTPQSKVAHQSKTSPQSKDSPRTKGDSLGFDTRSKLTPEPTRESKSVPQRESPGKSSSARKSPKTASPPAIESKSAPHKESPAKHSSSSPRKSPKTASPPTTESKSAPHKESPAKHSSSSPRKSAASSRHDQMEQETSQSSKRKSEVLESPAQPDAKKARGIQYRQYLQREGPSAPGSKKVPEGEEECFCGLTFVLSGVYESLDRDEAAKLIKRYGGRVTGSVSSKTSYLVAGAQAGESKTSKAAKFGTKIIDEDGLLDLIRTRSEMMREKAGPSSSKTRKSVPKSESVKPVVKTASKPDVSSEPEGVSKQVQGYSVVEDLLWVDKYKPQTMKQLIGQQGDRSNARKLYNWLQKWNKNAALGKHSSGAPAQGHWGGGPEDAFKAALLSGPPGVGKTSTAQVVCQELGFSSVELNASDARSKKTLDTVVTEILQTKSITAFNSSGIGNEKGRVLIMDEVDGMAGNEDRGGVQELIQLIKKSKVPVICICNDRNHPKIRSLAFYCLDLRFYKPKLEQIKAALMSISFKQGLKVPPSALTEIITAANQDIRQSVHNLSVWTATDKTLSYEQANADAQKAKKDLRLGAFDAARLALSGGEETRKMSIIDKTDLFFQDYSIMPLFIQENYARVLPHSTRDPKEQMKLMALAADSISQGDMCDALVRRNNWSLLQTQAILSTVIPGDMVRGTLPGMVNFPSWLGKNSSMGRTGRLAAELRTHIRLRANPGALDLVTHYLPALRRSLLDPLQSGDSSRVSEVLQLMDDYDLLRQDLDSMFELTQWPRMPDAWGSVSSKVKAALTRAYNKSSIMTPYSVNSAPTGKKRKAAETSEWGEEEEIQSESDEDDVAAIKNNPMIKTGSKAAKKGKAPAKGKATAGGKGKGKKIK